MAKPVSKLLATSLLFSAISAASAGASAANRVNERVYEIEYRGYATITAEREDGTFDARMNDSGRTLPRLTAHDVAVLSGCSGDVCVGDKVYLSLLTTPARIVGIQHDGKFVVQFDSLNEEEKTDPNWQRINIIVRKGCSPTYPSLCVGARVRSRVYDNMTASVLGIQADGLVLIRYADRGMKGRLEFNCRLDEVDLIDSGGGK